MLSTQRLFQGPGCLPSCDSSTSNVGSQMVLFTDIKPREDNRAGRPTCGGGCGVGVTDQAWN